MSVAQVIKNPLTMIGVFASLVEVAGSIVLPQLSGLNQSIYLSFLIVFPSGLVVFFFIVLWFKHKNLYAPGDYSNEKHFMDAISSQTPSEAKLKQVEDLEEANEIILNDNSILENAEDTNIDTNTEITSETQVNHVIRPTHTIEGTRYLTAENLAIAQLSKMFGKKIIKGVTYSSNRGNSFMFDALVNNEDRKIIIEIKYINKFSLSGVRNLVRRFSEKLSTIEKEVNVKLSFVLFIVTDLPSERYEIIPREIKEMLHGEGHIPFEIEIYNYEDLKRLNPEVNLNS